MYKLFNLYWFCLTGNVGGMCNFPGSVSLQQKLEVMDRPVLQLHVTAQFYLASTGKCILEAWGWADTKDTRRREEPSPPLLNFGSSFYVCVCVFLLSLSIPYVNWASHEGCLFYLPFSHQYSDLPLFYFPGLFPCLSFSQQPPPFQTHFSYFNYLTKQLTHTHTHTTEILYIYMCWHIPQLIWININLVEIPTPKFIHKWIKI